MPADDPNWLTAVAKAPLRLRSRNGEMSDGTGDLFVINHVDYVRMETGSWVDWALSSGKQLPLFNWVSIFNFHPGDLLFSLELGGRSQVMMMVRERHVVRCESGQRGPLVYVGFLEVAPWNDPSSQTRPLNGLGPIMLRMACDLSLQNGFGGRVGLHSVVAAEAFYRRLGFQGLGCPNEYNELYFELDDNGAQVLLSR